MPTLPLFSPTRSPVPEGVSLGGPAQYDPTRDDAYDALVLRDLPAYGAYWPMKETSGTKFFDRGSMGLHLTFPSGVKLNQIRGPIVSAEAIGMPNTAAKFTFPATQTPLPTDDFHFGGLSPFSLEGWIYHNSMTFAAGGNSGRIYRRDFVGGSYRTRDAGLGYGLRRSDNAGGSQSADAPSTGPLAPKLKVWTYILYTYDGATISTYINMVLGASAASTVMMPSETNQKLQIIDQSCDLYACRFAVYSTALTPAQGLDHYLAGRGSSMEMPSLQQDMSMYFPRTDTSLADTTPPAPQVAPDPPHIVLSPRSSYF